jgi:FlaA1/EpsC-like NDP-sugar epimerase
MSAKEFQNKRIFVTGGTGSIGWEIIQSLFAHQPKEIVAYSRDEQRQLVRSRRLMSDTPVRFVIGDVRDHDKLQAAMHGCDIVFHAAALKHVDKCESNPYEALQTNAVGTQNVIDAAVSNGVEKFVGISTDKASHPNNVLGATKLLAEKIMLAAPVTSGNTTTKMCFVRFGNVLGSRGSVIPLFLNQIKNNKPLTVTDPEMTRFFMSIPQAVGLVFKAASLMRDREIFVLKMPAIVIRDLLQATIELAREKNKHIHDVNVIAIGSRPGENKHEKLLSEKESRHALETDDMFIIMPSDRAREASFYAGAREASVGNYDSNSQKPLSVAEIKAMLICNDALDFQL